MFDIWVSELDFRSFICMDSHSNGLHAMVWRPPAVCCIKLNTNGSVWKQVGISGFGGVIRDAEGN